MDKKTLWELLYELTGDPWTETEEDKDICEQEFYKDLASGDVQTYIDSLEENKGYACRPIDGIYGEYDFKQMELFDKVIREIEEYRESHRFWNE